MLTVATIADRILSTPILAWSVGWQEILVIVVVVLILFGGKKIPELAKGLGKGLREFKREISGVKKDFEDSIPEDEETYEPPRKKVVRRPPSEADLTDRAEQPAHAAAPAPSKPQQSQSTSEHTEQPK
jgi:sec-independent protein translocase protein TatA